MKYSALIINVGHLLRCNINRAKINIMLRHHFYFVTSDIKFQLIRLIPIDMKVCYNERYGKSVPLQS